MKKFQEDTEMKLKTSIIYILPFLTILFLSNLDSLKAQTEVDTQTVGPPDQQMSIDNFKDSLSDKGEWIKVNPDEIDPDTLASVEDSSAVDGDICTDYIWVPSPVIIYVGWNPYCDGRWAWTYWGWMWYPNYNWGWCTYHYGRWWHHRHHGWVWSPGRRWRHSWVTWVHSGRYVGWHSLPPRMHYKSGVAVLPVNKNTKNDGWVFVDKKDMSKPIDNTRIVDPSKHTDIIKDSKQYVDNNNFGSKTNGTKTVDWNSKIQDNTRNNTSTNQSSRRTSVNYKQNDAGTKSVYRGYENYPNRYKENTGSRYNNNNNTGSRSGSWNNGSRSSSNYGSRSNNSNSGPRSNSSNNGSRSSSSNHGRSK